MGDTRHDAPTVAAIAVLAFVISDLSHEALGHAAAAYLSGSKHILLSYTYVTSDLQSRWISAAGPLVNLVSGLLALWQLYAVRMRAELTYFLFLLLNFNLLVAAAYLCYSGVLNSGDLAVVVSGLSHPEAIRLAMVLGGLALYWAFVVVGGRQLRRFQFPHTPLVAAAYLVAFALNCGAAIFNPLGLKYFLISAVPTTLAANAGMLAMPSLAEDSPTGGPVLQVKRRRPWIVAGVIAGALYILVIGPGLTLR